MYIAKEVKASGTPAFELFGNDIPGGIPRRRSMDLQPVQNVVSYKISPAASEVVYTISENNVVSAGNMWVTTHSQAPPGSWKAPIQTLAWLLLITDSLLMAGESFSTTRRMRPRQSSFSRSATAELTCWTCTFPPTAILSIFIVSARTANGFYSKWAD